MRVRRMLLVMSIVGLSFTSVLAPAAVADPSPVCEGYCLTAGVACYASIGLLAGKDKCDAFYEGCVDGCQVENQLENE